MSDKGSYRSRWAVYKGVSEKALTTQKDPKFNVKQTTHGSLTQDNICAEPGTKYLNRERCGGTNQQFTFGK